VQMRILGPAARALLIAFFDLAAAGGLANAATSFSTLYSFLGGSDGAGPSGGLIADAAGNLFGTTLDGGASGVGTVFEIARTTTGYASTPTRLVSFSGTNGSYPASELIIDASGDLFGTTAQGGAYGWGTVFEIVKTATGYASYVTILISFSGIDGGGSEAGLISDDAGNLIGTTSEGGASFQSATMPGFGTVFEVAKTATGYASAPTTLVSFNGANGEYPYAGLIADAGGNLFGTTSSGGANGDGTIFEIPKTVTGYASNPTTLATFNGANGQYPFSVLVADASGDLFGTTYWGGANYINTGRENGNGTVFEIVKTATGYAATPTSLVNFGGVAGEHPGTRLVLDATGNLFGTTAGGGANGYGTVFEILKGSTGFASTPTNLADFNGTNGSDSRHRDPEAGRRVVEDTIGVFRAGKKCEPVSSIICAVHAGLWQAVTELPDIS
jgi:uncharacterized repeat protein (TIGR03803 family)